MTSMLHHVFQQRLREIRKERGLTQTQIADLLKIRQPTYAAIEAGDNEPTLGTVERIAEALEIDPAELLLEKVPA